MTAYEQLCAELAEQMRKEFELAIKKLLDKLDEN